MSRHHQDLGGASDWSYRVISVEFLRSFLMRHFPAKLMVALRNVCVMFVCRLEVLGGFFVSFETVSYPNGSDGKFEEMG